MANVPERYAARSRAQARERAEQLLRRLGQDGIKAAINVDGIAENLGIELIKVSSNDIGDDSFSGAFMQKDGKPYIFRNHEHNENRQRFSTAHEIGHFLLHSTAGQEHVFFRNDVSTRGTNPFEIQANAFASSLLMPEGAVRHFVPEPISAYDYAELKEHSDHFEVSEQAFTLRLQNLKLLVNE